MDEMNKLFDCRLEALLCEGCLDHLCFFSISFPRLKTCLPLA